MRFIAAYFLNRPNNIFIVTILFFLVLPSCGEHANIDWETYTSAEGGFTVKMPADTKKTEKVIMTPFGKQVTTFVTWKPPNLTIGMFKLFQVSFTDCPSRYSDSLSREQILDSSISLRVKDFADIDVDAQTIKLNSYPGRAFIFDVRENNTIAIVKQCIVNNKLYDLTVVLKRNYATNNEVNIFYNSFQVLYK